jgi:hypothetical protein
VASGFIGARIVVSCDTAMASGFIGARIVETRDAAKALGSIDTSPVAARSKHRGLWLLILRSARLFDLSSPQPLDAN